jgi:hypothetical protein
MFKMNRSRGFGVFRHGSLPVFDESETRPQFRGSRFMSNTLLHLSPETIADAIETNLVDSSMTLGKTEDAVIFRGSDVAWVYTGAKSLSRVLRPRFAPDDVEDRVEEISECFRQWDAGVSWIIGPTSWPPQIGQVLHESGYGNQEIWTGMALDLTEWSLDPNLLNNLRVERVVDPGSLAVWARLGDETDPAATIFSPENAGGDQRCRYYLAFADGKPVSRGMAFLRGDTVGLYWLDKVPGRSDRGSDRAVIAKALLDARAGGATTAVVPAATAVRGTLTEMGFKAYCQFNVYSWPPEPIKMSLH